MGKGYIPVRMFIRMSLISDKRNFKEDCSFDHGLYKDKGVIYLKYLLSDWASLRDRYTLVDNIFMLMVMKANG